MATSSLIFWSVIFIPLFIFVIWLVLQDKKNGKKVIGFLCAFSLLNAAQSYFPKWLEITIQVLAASVILVYAISQLYKRKKQLN